MEPFTVSVKDDAIVVTIGHQTFYLGVWSDHDAGTQERAEYLNWYAMQLIAALTRLAGSHVPLPAALNGPCCDQLVCEMQGITRGEGNGV